MKINVLQIVNHRGNMIYIRHVQGTPLFEYIAVVDNEIYGNFIIATRSILARLVSRDYPKKQIQDIVKYLLPMATTHVDTVLEYKAELREAAANGKS